MKNVKEVLSNIRDFWSPIIVGEMNDVYIKVAKVKGEFIEHDHKNSDELFYILKGSLIIEYEHETVKLQEGDVHVVKKGMLHKPIAKDECHIMLIESKETKHTGDVVTELTKSIEQQQ